MDTPAYLFICQSIFIPVQNSVIFNLKTQSYKVIHRNRNDVTVKCKYTQYTYIPSGAIKNRGQKACLWDPWVVIECGIFVLIHLYIACNYNPEIYLLIWTIWGDLFVSCRTCDFYHEWRADERLQVKVNAEVVTDCDDLYCVQFQTFLYTKINNIMKINGLHQFKHIYKSI